MTKIVAIVNITPDSFSDGGQLCDSKSVLTYIAAQIEAGADVVDIGAESTRPGATLLTPEEEWQRLAELLPTARRAFPGVTLSLDTRHNQTAHKALNEGIDWINDVSGASHMLEAIAGSKCHYVAMHSLSVPPKSNETLPANADVIQIISDWAKKKMDEASKAGIAKERLILDPGIGFGKTAAQNWTLLRNMKALKHTTGVAWLAGHSRKSFFGKVDDGSALTRDLETHIVSAYLASSGIDFLRVHNVAGTKRAIAVGQNLQGGIYEQQCA